MKSENKPVSRRKTQKADTPTIDAVARRQFEGDFLKGFAQFLVFLQDEKISLSWKAMKSANGFKMNHKGEGIGSITLGTSWFGSDIETKNCVLIYVGTAEVTKDRYSEYLEGQTDEIVGLFMEQIGNKCVHCRPTCGCSNASGKTISISNKPYENVCMNAHAYKFYASGGDMQTMAMCSPCAVYPPIAMHPVPVGTVKKLILARKAYIEKTLAAKNKV